MKGIYTGFFLRKPLSEFLGYSIGNICFAFGGMYMGFIIGDYFYNRKTVS